MPAGDERAQPQERDHSRGDRHDRRAEERRQDEYQRDRDGGRRRRVAARKTVRQRIEQAVEQVRAVQDHVLQKLGGHVRTDDRERRDQGETWLSLRRRDGDDHDGPEDERCPRHDSSHRSAVATSSTETGRPPSISSPISWPPTFSRSRRRSAKTRAALCRPAGTSIGRARSSSCGGRQSSDSASSAIDPDRRQPPARSGDVRSARGRRPLSAAGDRRAADRGRPRGRGHHLRSPLVPALRSPRRAVTQRRSPR